MKIPIALQSAIDALKTPTEKLAEIQKHRFLTRKAYPAASGNLDEALKEYATAKAANLLDGTPIPKPLAKKYQDAKDAVEDLDNLMLGLDLREKQITVGCMGLQDAVNREFNLFYNSEKDQLREALSLALIPFLDECRRVLAVARGLNDAGMLTAIRSAELSLPGESRNVFAPLRQESDPELVALSQEYSSLIAHVKGLIRS